MSSRTCGELPAERGTWRSRSGGSLLERRPRLASSRAPTGSTIGGLVSTLVIRLLGRPGIERDGGVMVPPRGHKAWAVLAYLVLAERPVARARLAGLLFSDAEDPLGAVRWTLAELRRALGVPDTLRGDPLELG